MPTILIDGVSIKYEEMGSGAPVTLMPGGRSGMEAVRGLAERLAPHYRVIMHDRRNCGASDVVIGGEPSEQEIWADDLNELLRRLDAYPAYVGGGSAAAGSRCCWPCATRRRSRDFSSGTSLVAR